MHLENALDPLDSKTAGRKRSWLSAQACTQLILDLLSEETETLALMLQMQSLMH